MFVIREIIVSSVCEMLIQFVPFLAQACNGSASDMEQERPSLDIPVVEILHYRLREAVTRCQLIHVQLEQTEGEGGYRLNVHVLVLCCQFHRRAPQQPHEHRVS